MTPAGGVPRFRANVVATLAGRLGAMAVALVFATLLARWIGLARYGTWSVFATFLGFSSVLDFGLVRGGRARRRRTPTRPAPLDRIPHLVHAGADARGAARRRRSPPVAVAALAALPLEAWSAIGDPIEARRAALVLPLAFTLNLQAAVWSAALTGLRRSAEAHLLRVAGTALAAILTLAVRVAARTPTSRGMLLVYSIVIFITGGVVAWRVHALVGAGHWPRWPGRWDGDAARALAGVGGAVQVSTLAAQAGDLALRSILGARFGPAAIGAYDLATRAAMAPRHAASAMPVALVPQAQAQAVSDGPASLAALHARSVTLVALVVVAGDGRRVAGRRRRCSRSGSARGPSWATITTLVRLLLVFHAVLAVGAVASAIGRALGRPGPEAIAAVAGNVAGVAAATLAAIASARSVPSPRSSRQRRWCRRSGSAGASTCAGPA